MHRSLAMMAIVCLFATACLGVEDTDDIDVSQSSLSATSLGWTRALPFPLGVCPPWQRLAVGRDGAAMNGRACYAPLGSLRGAQRVKPYIAIQNTSASNVVVGVSSFESVVLVSGFPPARAYYSCPKGPNLKKGEIIYCFSAERLLGRGESLEAKATIVLGSLSRPVSARWAF